ncbi:MAG TPA: SHOCT domain-containing protein [Pseudonocardiaceae bacterium]|nr:SHOCT domain-containing protein [Pseudonocardiaceae bacterium]
MMHWGYGMGGAGWLFMIIGTLLLWSLVVAAIVALVSYPRGRQSGPADQTPTPQQVLADRFARGEIDEEEYRRRVDVLSATPRSAL